MNDILFILISIFLYIFTGVVFAALVYGYRHEEPHEDEVAICGIAAMTWPLLVFVLFFRLSLSLMGRLSLLIHKTFKKIL